MERFIYLTAAVLLMGSLSAQTTPQPNDLGRDRNKDGSLQMQRDRREQDQRFAPQAGSPRAQDDTLDAAFFAPDTALASILLDRSQAQRVLDIDRVYSERLQDLGTTDPADERYRLLWTERREALKNILTPLQFSRWQELNGELTEPERK
ncbi:MAG TPA: hypothetical protein VGE21_04395 [Flavobacteriales bacterium]